MTRLFLSIFIIALTITLSACGQGDRATLDKNLAKACVAGIQVLSPREDAITFESANYSAEKSFDGVNLRRVNLTAQYVVNHGIVDRREYTCWFEEQRNMMGYLPKFYRLQKDGQDFGNVDGTIKGDYGALLNLQQAVEDVLEPR